MEEYKTVNVVEEKKRGGKYKILNEKDLIDEKKGYENRDIRR